MTVHSREEVTTAVQLARAKIQCVFGIPYAFHEHLHVKIGDITPKIYTIRTALSLRKP